MSRELTSTAHWDTTPAPLAPMTARAAASRQALRDLHATIGGPSR